MEMMGWLTNDLSSAVASYKKIKKIYEVKPEIEDSRNVVTLDHVSGNVEFDHVSFKLDGKQILSDISFSVKEGDARNYGGDRLRKIIDHQHAASFL